MERRGGSARRRGFALMLVLGLLFLLALLAAAFVSAVTVDRATARNHVDAVRARMAARSGVEAAVDRLRAVASTRGFVDDTAWHAFAGTLSVSAYVADGDRYRVRVDDLQGRINVNDGAALGPDHPVSRNLERLLTLLGAQPGVDIPGLGALLLRARPAAGYVDPAQLERVVGREAWTRVRPFLTVVSWSDPDVVLPVPLSRAVAEVYPVRYLRPPGGFRRGHGRNADGRVLRAPLRFGPVWGLDSLHPRAIEVVSRSPVNVNTASREVLVALLTDLEGVFLLERPRRDAAGYRWADVRHSLDSRGDEGDEIGFLHRTWPITGPGGRSREGVPAAAIVDEILACRESRASPGVAGLDYGASPFGGPFRSWDQFRLFLEALVAGGVIVDPRSGLFPDGESRRLASRAIADAIGANFNPNLNRNELNPDRALHRLVDKTDLIVNSTEFCFTPMGVFGIESEGVVGGPGGRVLARRTVSARVRLFDAVRETSQAQFRAGRVAERRPGPETSTNWSLETGPEPDNGRAPFENGLEGYVRLATMGGTFWRHGLHKPGGERWTTLSEGTVHPDAVPMAAPTRGHLGSSIHAHFDLDHAAHYHRRRGDVFRLPAGKYWAVSGDRASIATNVPDPGETERPPYGPLDEVGAPRDLRADGAYVERHSAFGYWIGGAGTFDVTEGGVAFWFKPSFHPQLTGKPRVLVSAGRVHAQRPGSMNPSPFGLFFLPGSGSERAPLTYPGPFRSRSIAFGYGYSAEHGYNTEVGGRAVAGGAFAFTPTLNHEDHGDGVASPLRDHAWVHVGTTWRWRPGETPDAGSLRVTINGRPLSGTKVVAHGYPGEGPSVSEAPSWNLHALQVLLPGRSEPAWCVNTIRLGGEPSFLLDRAFGSSGRFPRNFAADGTIDEFYLWTSARSGIRGIRSLWRRGRYYPPDDGDPDDARFTSQAIRLGGAPRRVLAPAAAVPEPQGRGPSGGISAPARRPRLLAVAWTVMAGGYDPDASRMRPTFVDHSELPVRVCHPDRGAAEVQVEVGGRRLGPYANEAWSGVRGGDGLPPVVDGPVRYSVKLRTGTGPGAVLLDSPYLDDVTLFYESGRVEVMGWVER